jgi:D-3-phosphoglycerate dehydrogenase
MKAVFLASQKTGMTLERYKHICEENGIEFVLSYTTDHDEIVEMSKDTDVFLTSITPLPAELIERLDGRVKGLVRIAIGYDIIDVDAASKRGIPVCNIPDYGIEEVAVHAMTLVLSIIKKVPLYDKAMRKGQWTKQVLMLGHTPRRLSTLTLGLLGFGHIAKNVAQYAKGFGMKVVAADPYIPEAVFTELGVQKVTNDELFAAADVISVHVPLFKETFHLIGRDSIAKMKDGVFIVNTARGPLVSEADLVEALKSGKVAAAGLDVFEEEPISDPKRELLQLDNVVVTPHIAYHSQEGFEDLQRKACITAVALCKGEMPYNAVNKKEIVK